MIILGSRIIVDTSSILFALSNKVDIFNAIKEDLGLDPVISRGVVKELQKFSESSKGSSRYAKVALQLIDKYGIKTDPDSDYVDNWILSKAKDMDNVCTNDTKLRNALRGKGVKVYVISRSGEFR